MKKLVLLLIIANVLIGTPNPANCSVYYNVKSKIMGYGGTTKNWTVKYFNITKDWSIKHTIIVKDGAVCFISNEVFCDMLYLTADGFTFGLILDDERCKDIIRRHPVSGRIVAISSRIIAVYIVSKGVEKIIYYIVRHFAVGGVYTSQGIDGVVNYVGQTKDFTRRGIEWARVGRVITPVYKTPFLCERRVVEETLINRYGLANLVNKIHSISP